MSTLPEELLRMEQELADKNSAIDRKAEEVMRLVAQSGGTPAAAASSDAAAAAAAASASAPSQPSTRTSTAAARPSSSSSAAAAVQVQVAAPATAAAPAATAAGPLSASRITALEEKLKSTILELQRVKQDRERATTDAAKQTKIVAALTAKIEKDKAAKDDALAKAKAADDSLLGWKRETTALKKSVKAAEAKAATAEARLQRALDEVERWKGQAQSQASQQNAGQPEHEEAVAKLQHEVRRLQSQKQELLSGFRKQAKLIDVLKRQKAHAEAAKLLSFTEDEFVRTLDLGESLGSGAAVGNPQ